MNSPSNRRHAWSWLPVEFTCGGLLFVGMAASIVMAQENPTASPPPAPTQPAVSLPVAVPEFLPRLSPVEQKILLALSEPTEVAFTDIPLEEALNYLKDLHKIEIWLYKESLASEGIATDQLVNLSISGISLRSALRLLLEPLQLTCVIEDEVLKITTQDSNSNVDKRLVTRTYPVGDLFDSREEGHELVEVIVSGLGLRPKEKDVTHREISIKTPTSEIDSSKSAPTKESKATPDMISSETRLIQESTSGEWYTTVESGTFAVSVKARAIVARQTHAVHDQIHQLLRDLREAKSLAPTRPLAEFDAPRSRIPCEDATRSPIPLDEFSPGSESRTPIPRLRVHGKPELSIPVETPATPKSKPGR